MAVAECLGSVNNTFLIEEGPWWCHRRLRACREGKVLNFCLQPALISCLTAARLIDRCWAMPLAVAALAALSAASFSCLPTWAGHHTRVTDAVGERHVSNSSESIEFLRRDRPGVVRRR